MPKPFPIPNWVRHTNVYEVNLRQYSQEGTMQAFIPALPRLRAMGVETLWFMPITPIARQHMKGTMGSYYACASYKGVDPEFGTEADFRELVKSAHELGFKVILDWVANHTGWGHEWTVQHPDWYEKDPATGDFKRASGMDDIIELDFYNADMRAAMIEAMQWWVKEFDIDGFRCDLAAWVEYFFWQEARPELEKIKPLFWLGEFDELENPEYMGVFDACYSWKWMHRTREFYQQRYPLYELESLLERYQQVNRDGSMQIWFTSNHDENSWNGTEYEKYGDMARGLAVFSATWSGIPLVYTGQEAPNHKRLAFFDKDPVEWTGQFYLENFYKTLLQLHSQHPALCAGDPDTLPVRLHTSADDKLYAYLRKKGEREVLVILHFSDEFELTFSIPDTRLEGTFTELFSGQPKNWGEEREARIMGWGYYVYVK